MHTLAVNGHMSEVVHVVIAERSVDTVVQVCTIVQFVQVVITLALAVAWTDFEFGITGVI